MAWEARSREVLAMRVQLWPRILVRFWPYEPRFGQKYCDVMSWPWPRKKACLFELAWQMNYVGNTILLLGRGWSRWKDSVYSSFKSPSYRLQIWWIPKVFFVNGHPFMTPAKAKPLWFRVASCATAMASSSPSWFRKPSSRFFKSQKHNDL